MIFRLEIEKEVVVCTGHEELASMFSVVPVVLDCLEFLVLEISAVE